jgi:hypothetical protein
MMTVNPYSPPQTDIEQRLPAAEQSEHIELTANGQKMIIKAILLYFAMGGLSAAFGNTIPLGVRGLIVGVGLAAIVGLSLVGVLRLSRGLGVRMPFRVLLALLLFVPFVNLVALAIMNGKATRVLRAAGYRVGLFGAYKPA